MPQLSTEQATQLRPGLRTLQAITLAMVMTQFLFVAVILAAINTNDLHSDLKMLIFLAAATGIVLYVNAMLFAPMFRKSVNASDPPELSDVKTVTASLQTAHLIQVALISAGVYLNLMVFLLDKGYISLIVASIGAAMLLLMFPTLGRYRRGIEKRLTV